MLYMWYCLYWDTEAIKLFSLKDTLSLWKFPPPHELIGNIIYMGIHAGKVRLKNIGNASLF